MGKNFLTIKQALREYALELCHLNGLREFQRRSPVIGNPPIIVYMRKDIERQALNVWKSATQLDRELKKRAESEKKKQILVHNLSTFGELLKMNGEYRATSPRAKLLQEVLRNSFRSVAINGINFVLKLIAWVYTGSSSLFSEMIHSLADTCNQFLVAYGIIKSNQLPDRDHPYGYHQLRYIVSLISGVSIFFTGTGVSVYHGIDVLMYPSHVESGTPWVYWILIGSLISQSISFGMVVRTARKAATMQGHTLVSFIRSGFHPTYNTVVLEGFASVVGVAIALGSLSLTHIFQNTHYDAIGSLLIGGLLGVVASFVIYRNAGALVGKSISPERKAAISEVLASDNLVRAIHDVKAIDMGNEMVNFKAEIELDSWRLCYNYLETIDVETLLEEMKRVNNIEECQEFVLKHGDHLIDMLGAEVNRIEKELISKHPQVIHVLLEVL